MLALWLSPRLTPGALAQDAAGAVEERVSPYQGRPVVGVRFEGIEQTSSALIRNQIRTAAGSPFDEETVSDDIRRLYRLGRFYRVSAAAELLESGGVTVVFTFVEAPTIVDVAVTGNTRLSDDEIAGVIDLVAGTFVDEHQIDNARRSIENLYRTRGYYLAQVTVDEDELKNGVVLFLVREGQRVRVTDIRFRGNKTFTRGQLLRRVSTKRSGILEKGPLDYEKLDLDVAALVRWHLDHGFLDVRADREVIISADGREAIVTFLIDEGPRHRLRSVNMINVDDPEKPPVLAADQAAGLMRLKPGDVYSVDKVRSSIESIRNAYWALGHYNVEISTRERRAVDTPEVDLEISVSAGDRYRTGEIIVQGNSITKRDVILRQVRMLPDRPLDRADVNETTDRLIAGNLFRIPGPGAPSYGVKVTPQPEEPDNPGYRDVLIEVEETVTGRFSIGAAISSDAGVIGTLAIQERNFDLAAWPHSIDELLAGEAFRGAGQSLNLTLAPGTQVQTYSLTLTEPYLLETDNSLTVGGAFRTRRFQDHDEERLGFSTRLGRRFGDRWVAGLTFRAEQVQLNDIDTDAPVDLFAVAETNTILGVGVELTRTTVPFAERVSPTRGARTELAVEQIFGDFGFTKLRAEHSVFLPIREDLDGRVSTLSIDLKANWIPQRGEAPIYERYFLGGRSFRGFDFRGVSPRGIRADTLTLGNDPVGGEWSFFAGAEYQFPLAGVNPRTKQPILGLVVFLDSGTVTNDPGFDDYRVSTGFGFRLRIPALGQAPLAFDFGFPIIKQDRDETRLFSFSVDLPF
ncbi:MAG: outer membrane protein assembly factor BamA [Phycisphaeraceae bacterium]|nr:outer membrane protein assembly factor BamA [Phycisphaeraceae bacterium]MCB9846999.1 outer membrane protein assembly factor BamA [Phycisphaeraceae bacterium]